jgi:hypothetical protein
LRAVAFCAYGFAVKVPPHGREQIAQIVGGLLAVKSMKQASEKKRQKHSITVTNLGDGVRVTGGSIPPIIACSLLFEAFVEVSKSFGMSRHDIAEQLRNYARQIEAMGEDEYHSGIRPPIR